MRHIKILAVSLFASLLLSGCGSKGPTFVVEKKIKPASGKFTIDGQPPGSDHVVVIKLYPKGRAPKPGEVVQTKVEADGKFAFSTYVAGDGAPEGEYLMCWESLTMVPFTKMLVGPDRFKNNFSNPVSQDQKYSLTVSAQNKESIAIPAIDVKMADLVDMEPHQFSTPLTVSDAR